MVMVLGVSNIALADGALFYGTCTNYFTLSKTWNKVNDKSLEVSIDTNDYGICKIEATGVKIDCTATIYIDGTSQGSKTLKNGTNSSNSKYVVTNTTKGTASARVTTSQNGTRTYIEGAWYIYNGATTRTITHV